MELEDILKIVNTVSDSSLTKFNLKQDGLEINIEQNMNAENNQIFKPTDKSGDKSRIEGNEKTKVIKSPLVGTFYDTPSPDSEPFLKTGDVVKKGQIIGIIEAMKLMNEIVCEDEGIIEKIHVQTEQLVGYDQPLFTIKFNE